MITEVELDRGPTLGNGDVHVPVSVGREQLRFGELLTINGTIRTRLSLWDAELRGTVDHEPFRAFVHATCPLLVVTRGGDTQFIPLGSAETAREDVRKARLTGVRVLELTHRAWWHRFYRRSSVSVPDPAVREFYWRELYLAATTKVRGPWLVHTANHVELDQSATWLRDHFTEQPDPWLLYSAWRAHEHTMDLNLLRDTVFPLLRRVVDHYLHSVALGDDGRLHLPRETDYDLALLRWGCTALLKATNPLGVDDPLASLWQTVLMDLAPCTTEHPADVETRPLVERSGSGTEAQALLDGLLQSWGGVIRVFPTAVWPDAAFDRLLARGAFEVSATRRAGRTTWISVHSLAGEPVRVRHGISGVAVSTPDGRELPFREDGEDVVIELATGGTAELRPVGSPPPGGRADVP